MEPATTRQQNKYFLYRLDEICAICNTVFENNYNNKIPLSSCLTTKYAQDNTKAYTVLESISKFQYSENGPQSLCANCFKNTEMAYKFQLLCNKSQMNFELFKSQQQNIHQKENDIQIEKVESVENEDDSMFNDSSNEAMNDDFLDEDSNDDSGPNDVVGNNLIEQQVKWYEEIEPPPIDYSNRNRKVRCLVCYHIFSLRSMIRHQRFHTGVKPYKCDQCDKRFRNLDVLKAHVTLVHENRKDFVCKVCGKALVNKSALNVHEQSHLSEKKFKCNVCDKGFVTNGRLKIHLKTHSGERPYSCEYCGKTYTRMPHLKDHVKIHTGEKPFTCNLCGKAFLRTQHLKKHLANHPDLPLTEPDTSKMNVQI